MRISAAKAGEDEGGLLAAPPAKRDPESGKLITHKSTRLKKRRGISIPQLNMAQAMERNGRPQNYRAKGIPQPKTWLPGSPRLKSLGKGIYENQESTYNQEEKLLFESREEVKNLIAGLENLETKTDENEA